MLSNAFFVKFFRAKPISSGGLQGKVSPQLGGRGGTDIKWNSPLFLDHA